MQPLQHECPRWEGDDDDPTQDIYVWPGAIRYVSAKRARKLRKRGVPMLPVHAVCDPSGTHRTGQFYPTTPNGRARYAWFEPIGEVEERITRKSRRCYNTWLDANRGLIGRKKQLANRLDGQRARLRAARSAYVGRIHENLIQTSTIDIATYLYSAGFVPEDNNQFVTSWNPQGYAATLARQSVGRATRQNTGGALDTPSEIVHLPHYLKYPSESPYVPRSTNLACCDGSGCPVCGWDSREIR